MIVAYGVTMLVDQINTLVERMRRDLGEKLHCYETQDAVYDLIMFPFCGPWINCNNCPFPFWYIRNFEFLN